MSQKKFTEEEQEILRSNPNTYFVTSSRISFTKEFKARFYKDYMDGMIPRDILEKNGYSAEILGNRRIWGIASMIKDQYEKNGGFYDTPDIGRNKKADNLQGEVDRLTHEVEYLKQEIAFLKKLSSLKSTSHSKES